MLKLFVNDPKGADERKQEQYRIASSLATLFAFLSLTLSFLAVVLQACESKYETSRTAEGIAYDDDYDSTLRSLDTFFLCFLARTWNFLYFLFAFFTRTLSFLRDRLVPSTDFRADE